MQIPGAIVFVNNDLNTQLQTTIEHQLKTTETITFQEFNARIEVDLNYSDIIRNTNSRLLVILPTFQDKTNRELADVVIFVSHGLAAVERNKYGPHGFTTALSKLNIYDLLRNAKPFPIEFGSTIPKTNRYIVQEDGSIINGVFSDHDIYDRSGARLPNPDNIYNNPDFLNRKP